MNALRLREASSPVSWTIPGFTSGWQPECCMASRSPVRLRPWDEPGRLGAQAPKKKDETAENPAAIATGRCRGSGGCPAQLQVETARISRTTAKIQR